MDFSKSLEFNPSGELIISLVVMGLIIIASIVVGIIFKKADPYKQNGKFVNIVSDLVESLQNYTTETMGKKYIGYSALFLAIAMYLFFSFVIGVTGLPNPLASLTNTASVALITFILIHFKAMQANKWKYFKRYIDPIPIFLPINLLSMWAPLLSLALRLFGNALAGYCLMSIVYFFISKLGDLIFFGLSSGVGGIFIAPILTPVLHVYFDLFSGLIQTIVFLTLSMIFISQENPDESEEESIALPRSDTKVDLQKVAISNDNDPIINKEEVKVIKEVN